MEVARDYKFITLFQILNLFIAIFFLTWGETFFYIGLLTMGTLFLGLLSLLILKAYNRSALSPVSFFALSIFVFLLTRIYIWLVSNRNIVDTGIGVEDSAILATISYLLIGVSFIVFGNQLFFITDVNLKSIFPILKSNYWKISYSYIGYVLSAIFAILFIFGAYEASLLIKQGDFWKASESGELYRAVKYFMIAKWIGLACIFFSNDKKSCLYFSLITGIASIGFLLIGLRGYAFIYIFLMFFFINEFKKISFLKIVVGVCVLIWLAGYILEYRLGYKVYNNFLDMLLTTAWAQSATFEVMFGAVNFQEKLQECISIESYFRGQDFGKCVDVARQINWSQGGFASSSMAELFYLGIGPYIVFCFIIGVLLRWVDYISFIRRTVLESRGNGFMGFSLIILLPSLIYFARASAFDFLKKVFFVLFLMIIIRLFFLVASKLGFLKKKGCVVC